jgi:hypothetical protein
MTDEHDSPRRVPIQFHQEQAGADLDQSVADRQQALADADQESIERDQADLDEQRDDCDPSDLPGFVGLRNRQAELDRRQAQGDARQEQIEHAQEGGDLRQALLDDHHDLLAQPTQSDPANPAELAAEIELRTQATVKRAKNARRRAHLAMERATAAEQRAQAMQERDAPRPGDG